MQDISESPAQQALGGSPTSGMPTSPVSRTEEMVHRRSCQVAPLSPVHFMATAPLPGKELLQRCQHTHSVAGRHNGQCRTLLQIGEYLLAGLHTLANHSYAAGQSQTRHSGDLWPAKHLGANNGGACCAPRSGTTKAVLPKLHSLLHKSAESLNTMLPSLAAAEALSAAVPGPSSSPARQPSGPSSTKPSSSPANDPTW